MQPFRLRRLPGLQDYLPTLEAMRSFTDGRDEDTPDELWLLEHPPVFTLGQAGRREHLLDPGDIPVVQVDRGGQVTYHGPGQLIAYLMLDLRRFGVGVKRLVSLLEQSVIELLASYGIEAARRTDAPGVYVSGAKIASLGLRVRNGCCYHGLALNVSMDLEPFRRINPCGYAGLPMTQVSNFVSGISVTEAGGALANAMGLALNRQPAQQPGRPHAS
ncbi:lipoyl(octanoyl) transferase LipB [Thiorhodococcus mannitoliphagus]|uniref:Octanoyltransferase n=1 Tax=Thiorhodococcus mannitoliphagus TaxID=329406 RepID=A0A6P1DXZ5_9GAMM|nr:lipoyl(octanoyl) transferase LipB [Thiorhodococcus mannitoliphagus]NEX20485.1 lipoyl(octanoyl) transferase LipB [Thiorhodococcus mannitoliphagus]